ncbi:MAG: GAF domain-containing protein [Candidatus Zixiibacteriota bacterium]
MHNATVGLALLVFLLGLEFFLLRERQRHFQYYPQSWRVLALGVGLFSLAAGLNLVFISGAVDQAYGGKLQTAFSWLETLGSVAGGSLMVLGLWRWCASLAGVKRNGIRRLRQVACLNSLLSVVNHRQESDEMLKESLSALLSIMGYRMGVVFKPTFNSSEMTVVAHAGVAAENLFALFGLASKNVWYKESSQSKEVATTTEVRSLPEYGTVFSDQEEIRSFACVPIKFREKVIGLIGLYDSQGDRFSYQETQFLTSVGEILGLAGRNALTSDRNKRRRDYISALETMLKINQEGGPLEETFSKISRELKRIVDFHHVSLALAIGSGRNMKRISMGSSGGVLVDKRSGVPTEGSLAGTVMNSKEVWIDRNINSNENSSEDSLSRACGIKSRIILPLWSKETVCGALSLGHQEPNFYSANDAKWLRPFTLGLSHLIWEHALREKLIRNESLNRSLDEFERRLVGEENLKTLLEEVAESLTLDLRKSFARVTLLNKQKNQLITCGLHQIRSEGIDLNMEKRVSLDDLPWHRLALEAQRPMLINQEDPESLMSRGEARLILDQRVRSAFLVPLVLEDAAVGLISVGEMRNWDREPLTEEEMAFVKHKADQTSVGLKKGLLLSLNQRLKERLKSSQKTEAIADRPADAQMRLSELSYQINNPLTLIRGSAELLKLKESNLSPEALKYLRNIENGVDRIHQGLEEFLRSPLVEEEQSGLGQPREQTCWVG